MNDKLDLQSKDITSLNIEKIATLFPNCVTETAEGKKIDFDLLKQELSTEIVEGNKERYRLEWPGKREAIVTANIPTTKTLRPVREDSVDFDTTENIYIEGDNLEVLKLLQESYLNKIKMIYIDPPYNTGKDFVYKDNFAKDGDEELIESGQKDEYNQRLVANPETSGRYHSDWLSMMYPRLKLARNLLTEDGVIFISIDDNEVHNLRKICDEIFGEGNFVANIIWKKRGGPPNDKILGTIHDYIIAIAKDTSKVKLYKKERSQEQLNRYSNPDNHPKGEWAADNLMANVKGGRFVKSLHFGIKNPQTGEIHYPGVDGNWRYNQGKIEELLKNDEIYFGKDGNGRPKLKRFLAEVSIGVPYPSIWDDVPHNNSASKEIEKLLGNLSYFETPKPSGLINDIIRLGSNSNDIILDFFSGSATTAHAVMQLNAEDGGNRKYIMVQLPEANDEKSEAFKAGYKNICEIGKERIRRAAKKIKESLNQDSQDKKDKQDLSSGDKNPNNQENQANPGSDIDLGFRVYRLDSSNMQDVYYKPQDYNQLQLDLFADNVKEDRTAEDLVTQVMLDWGLPLSLPIERKTILAKEVYAVAGDSLYCCFDDGIDEDFAKAIAQEKPLRIVFRDKGFKDDTAKENVKQLLKQLLGVSENEMKDRMKVI
ncbi:site-specific DNA-methyltransferase [Chryseobacterium gambrini]|uniref:site-specific DNA-methyltransferase (adenine-specific) n=1 Tax=Chryseobacterium gambrini TaxID=373672 RepID=A0ABN7CAR8_9FLAO|nr:site-specific DNA-methyltransferase [Chryseobacterium gambrini]